MNHKRRRPKHQRGGCLLCKPHKDERESSTKAVRFSVQRQLDRFHLPDEGWQRRHE
jgi:hypothetical protein